MRPLHYTVHGLGPTCIDCSVRKERGYHGKSARVTRYSWAGTNDSHTGTCAPVSACASPPPSRGISSQLSAPPNSPPPTNSPTPEHPTSKPTSPSRPLALRRTLDSKTTPLPTPTPTPTFVIHHSLGPAKRSLSGLRDEEIPRNSELHLPPVHFKHTALSPPPPRATVMTYHSIRRSS